MRILMIILIVLMTHMFYDYACIHISYMIISSMPKCT